MTGEESGDAGLSPGVEADLRAAAPDGRLEEVREAFLAGAEALGEGDLSRAVELLERARDTAPDSAAVREALGIARYHREEFAAAARELESYRRLSGSEDQNHLLADCARALGDHRRVGEYVEAMTAAGADEERVAEGLIVLAGDHADRGDLQGALATVQRADLAPAEVEPHHVRLWYVAADLAERLGDVDAARGYLEAVTAVTEGYLDARERLAALEEAAEQGGAS